MAEIKRRVIGSAVLANGRLATLDCSHKAVLPTKFPTQFPEDVVCEQCTASQRAVDELVRNTNTLTALGVGAGRY